MTMLRCHNEELDSKLSCLLHHHYKSANLLSEFAVARLANAAIRGRDGARNAR